MNKSIIVIILIIGIAALGWIIIEDNAFETNTSLPTQVYVEFKEINLGKLKQNEPCLAIYQLTNIGANPLIIQHVEANCGCTKPEWPKKPIKPAKSAEIKVTYDAEYPGRFIKQIKVYCNTTEGVIELRILGEVSNR